MDIESFKKDILPLKDKLFRLAKRILINPAEAEDAVQEVFIKVWQKRKDLNAIKNREAWMLKLTRNQSIDLLRSRKNEREDIDQLHSIKDPQIAPDQELSSKDGFNAIKKMINQLPEQQRIVIQLRDIEGMSYQEISDLLEISISQVKVQIFRARQQLRAVLEKNYHYES